MHCTTLSGWVRIYGGWVEKFLRLLLWELSGGSGGKETGMPFQRQVPRWMYFIREPLARYYRAGNSMVPPKNLLVRPFEVFRLRVLAVVMMASAPCILCADAVVANVSPVPTEVAPFLANQKGDATASSGLGSFSEDSSEDLPEDPPDMSHSFCLGSREVLTGIFPTEVRTTRESLRPDTLRRGPAPSHGGFLFRQFSPIRSYSKSPLAMRRPKPGTLWLEPLDAWCGSGIFSGRHTFAVGCGERGPLLICNSTQNEVVSPSRAFAAEAKAGVNLRMGGDVLNGETEERKRLAHLPEWVPAALRQAGALVNEFRTESLKLDTSPNLADVREYFEDALGETPVEDAAGRLLFERWDDLDWGVSWRRGILSGLDGILYLDWLTNDDFGLSEAREFFEAPFFDAVQTRLWYTWLAAGGWHEAVVRGRRMGMSVGVRGHVVHLRLYW